MRSRNGGRRRLGRNRPSRICGCCFPCWNGSCDGNGKDHVWRTYADGNVVVVQLALQGTHDGPLQLPFGELPATGKHMDAPCCDVFELEDGKIKRFDCYPEGSIIFAQLGVLNNLDAALSR
jgi:hypothetical protein